MKIIFIVSAFFLLGCQHSEKVDSIATDTTIITAQLNHANQKISELQGQIKSLDEAINELKTMKPRVGGKYVTLYKCYSSINSECKPSPVLAGLTSDKCLKLMDSNQTDEDNKRKIAEKKFAKKYPGAYSGGGRYMYSCDY